MAGQSKVKDANALLPFTKLRKGLGTKHAA